MTNLENRSFFKHSWKNLIGLLICIVLFFLGFVIHGNTGLYLNISGFLIVVGGTLGATFLSYNMKRIGILMKVLKTSYIKPGSHPNDIVQILVDLSVKRRIKGLLALQDEEDETTIAFLRQAIGLLVDGYSKEQIRDMLTSEMRFFRMRRDETRRVLQTMADVAPSFGLVGSVVGLIGMLSGPGDASVIFTTIPVALTSTLYGIVLANFVFLPFASNIKEKTIQELFLQKIIAEGVLAISDNLHPSKLERKLKSFLTPSARTDKYVSYERIKKMFKLKGVSEHVG